VQLLAEPSTWTVVLLLLFGLVLLLAIGLDAPALGRFADQEYARGVITFVISLSTIGIAFVLIYQAFFSTESTDDRFRRGREVFTGLMGVLGTIVGFYFGSTNDGSDRLGLADLRLSGQEVTTFVTGGSPPYRYTLTLGGVAGEQRLSGDGWVVDSLPRMPARGETVTLDVFDARNRQAAKSVKMPADTAAGPGQSPGG
jgi:hypothetical protein